MDNSTPSKAVELVLKNNSDLFITYAIPFREIFGIPLSEYWISNVLGFDLIKFDEKVIGDESEEGISMKEVILREYGKIGIQTIEGLIGFIE